MRASMIPRSVICIRHGESTFNAAWRETSTDPLHFDAPLSPVGFEQVRSARTAVEALPVDLVVTSPLTRALQTAAGLFDGHRRSPRALAVEFPSLDLAHLDDVWWHVDGTPDTRGICVEPIARVAARAAQF